MGPIADSVLASYLANTQAGIDLIGAVFGPNGEPLWLSRTARYASDAQYLALVVRDKACNLHHQNLTLYQHRYTRQWHTRPATPTETPPRRISDTYLGSAPRSAR